MRCIDVFAAHQQLGFSRGAYTARALAGMLAKVIHAAENIDREI